jgi:hypothetical protein
MVSYLYRSQSGVDVEVIQALDTEIISDASLLHHCDTNLFEMAEDAIITLLSGFPNFAYMAS